MVGALMSGLGPDVQPLRVDEVDGSDIALRVSVDTTKWARY